MYIKILELYIVYEKLFVILQPISTLYTRMRLFLLIFSEPYAVFSGWDAFLYYWYVFRTFMQEYSWQVRLSYNIILASIGAMLFLMLLFLRNIRQRKNYKKAYQHCLKTYGEAFHEILEDDRILSTAQMLEICDADEDELASYSGLLYAEILLHIRMEMNDRLYIPNLQTLCELTGSRDALEQQLRAGKDVVHTLQVINTLPLYINEGVLAVYTGHRKAQISQLARITHLIISRTEPYLYLLSDMNLASAPWYRITIHRILGWKKEQNMPMAPLHMLASTCENATMAAFLIEEISYWGTDEEKAKLVDFFMSQHLDCRVAAIRATARLRLPGAGDKMYDTYFQQPQFVRREIQQALCSVHSGKYTEFYVKIYENTPSVKSQKVALECLYSYTPESRIRFEELYAQASDENKVLFDQIRTINQLQEAHARANNRLQ